MTVSAPSDEIDDQRHLRAGPVGGECSGRMPTVTAPPGATAMPGGRQRRAAVEHDCIVPRDPAGRNASPAIR
jgi:hypothetical protein